MTTLINPNNVFDGLFSKSEKHQIVYHGSGEVGLEFIDGYNPGYEGGLGSGTYVAFDRNVAECYSYGGSVYVLELLIPEDKILYLSSYDGEINSLYGVNNEELDSMFVGENVKPFLFSVNDKIYWVADDWNVDRIFAGMRKERISKELPEEFHYLIDEENGSIDISDAYLEIENKIYESIPEEEQEKYDDYYKHKPDKYEIQMKNNKISPEDLNNTYEKLNEEWENNKPPIIHEIENRTEDIIDKISNIVDKIENEVELEKNNILIIEMDEIGNVAEEHGYDAVYVEGIRGKHPDSELLVFEPKNLRLIREETPSGEIIREFK